MTDLADTAGLLHHVELWVPDLTAAQPRWDWLLRALGYQDFQRWEHGVSYQLGPTYLVLEQSPALHPGLHDRHRAGLNHLAWHTGTREHLDTLVTEAPHQGWRLLFPDRHPYAGGPQHYAGYLEDGDGFEVELVAS